jgi:hypothetical protein
MIIRDSHNLIVGDKTGDGGDTLNREGIASFLFGVVSPGLLICLNEKEYPVRHPYDEPWDNYKNCSRDQLIPAICVGFKLKDKDISNRILQTVKDHNGFASNIERDYVGTKKKPYPHDFINDIGQKEARMFDWADPITPDLWYLLLAGSGHKWKARLLYPLAKAWAYSSVFSVCYINSTDSDVWQTACVADCFGLLGYFDKHHPRGLRIVAEEFYGTWRGTGKFAELWAEYLDSCK